MNKKWLDKTIEIYDGNWCSHYVCPLGNIILVIGMVISAVGILIPTIQTALHQKPSLDLSIGVSLGGLVIYFIGSFMGRDVDGIE